jgi:hypothetical protein
MEDSTVVLMVVSLAVVGLLALILVARFFPSVVERFIPEAFRREMQSKARNTQLFQRYETYILDKPGILTQEEFKAKCKEIFPDYASFPGMHAPDASAEEWGQSYGYYLDLKARQKNAKSTSDPLKLRG